MQLTCHHARFVLLRAKFRHTVRKIMRNTMHAHAKTHMAACTYGPASAAPLGRLSLSENLVTSACTFHGSIVALPVPLLLLNKHLSTWARGSRHERGPDLSLCWKMLFARTIQNGNMPYELQPEAMCNTTHAMTSSEYRSGLETVRAHVNAMCTHVVALCLHF